MNLKKAFIDIYNYHKYGFLGNSIRIDASSICQLKCAACVRVCTDSQSNFETGIGQGHLKFSDFKNIVDENPSVKNIELSNWGEIFLNPALKEIIEYAFEKDVALTANNGVNLNTASEELLECLVKHNFRSLSVSLDGASNDTYEIYRVAGQFDRVIDNIKKINNYKHKYNTSFPAMQWQFIIFGHNEHELPIARQMADKLNMSFWAKLNAQNWDPSYSPIKNREFVIKETGDNVASVMEFQEKYGRNYDSPCPQFWLDPQINWDGRLLGCCLNIYSDFGNVFKSGLTECLKSEKYTYAKKMLRGEQKLRDDIVCARCPKYKNRYLPKKLRLAHSLGLID